MVTSEDYSVVSNVSPGAAGISLIYTLNGSLFSEYNKSIMVM